MIIVCECDIFLNQLILDYFSEFNVNKGLIKSSKIGHKELVQFFITKGADDWNRGMIYAVDGGHRELVDFFQRKIDEENNN